MNTFLTIILSVFPLVGQIRENINEITLNTLSDPDEIKLCLMLSDYGRENGCELKELFLKAPVDDAELERLLSIQNPDGSFSDIDYDDRHRGSWIPLEHCLRVTRLAIRYRREEDERAGESALRAIRYWHFRRPECPNWWANEIGVPRELGPGYLLMLDRMNSEDIAGAVSIMGRAKFGMTGQNKIWLAGNVLIRGLLEGDETLVRAARDTIASEIYVSDKVEGLQSDWSFHQHGPQLQFGNYGLAYASSLSWWAGVFSGTPIAFSQEQMSVLRDYVTKGLGQVVYNGWFDHNACGRQVFRNSQRGKALCVKYIAGNLGISLPGGMGGVYYPSSDFGIYRGRGWYASVRMQSCRTKGVEMTNGENSLGYFASDGALLTRRTGDEYEDISAVWNWKHIPGVTSYDDGQPLRMVGGRDRDATVMNRSGNVSGTVRGKNMTVRMEYIRDSLSARKAWFFWKGGIICLGAGISRPLPGQVVTTVEQNLLRGEVTSDSGWVSHNGITYVILDGSSYVLETGPRKGSWKPISPSYGDEEVVDDLFCMYLDHGSMPENASYAYAVVPAGRQGSAAARRISRKVKIIENTQKRQSVRIGLRRFSVEWE